MSQPKIFILCLFLLTTVVSAKTCFWISPVSQGVSTVTVLEPRWKKGDCNGVVSYRVDDANGNTALFPNTHEGKLLFTPSSKFTGGTVTQYTHVSISVLCNGLNPICDAATVYYNVIAAPSPSTNPPTDPPTTDAPEDSSSSSSSSPAPPALECGKLPTVNTTVSTPTEIHFLDKVSHCTSPTVELLPTSSSLFTIGSADSQPVLVFDAKATNVAEDIFKAEVKVTCDGKPAVGSCTMEQTVITYKQLTPEPELPSCGANYNYYPYFDSIFETMIEVHHNDSILCHITDSSARAFAFTKVSNPRYNAELFTLSQSGLMHYVAPSGPSPKNDMFVFTIGCKSNAGDGAELVPFCKATARLRVTSKPPEPQPDAYDCEADFSYVYPVSPDGGFVPQQSNVAMRASTVYNSMCADGVYKSARVLRQPMAGALSPVTEDGGFQYTPASAEIGLEDSFDFSLICASNTSYSCKATAKITISAPLNADTVYHSRGESIICKGSCATSNATRKDGREPGTVDVDFTADGRLHIHAYASLGSLQSQFVSFTPMTSDASLLTSGSVVSGSHMSFEPSCLDKQSVHGTAANMVSGSEQTLNTLSDNYRLGDNYYQKFGGQHQFCDIYRTDACKFAPFMSPTLSGGSGTEIQWKVFINDCDATWVGEATVASLRALRQPDGSPTFKLSEDSTTLSGTLYVQTIAPVSMTEPEKGYATTEKTHDLVVTIRNTITTDVTTVVSPPVSAAMDLAPDVQFAVGKDSKTKERLYAYSILMFPSRMSGDTIVPVSTTQVTITSFSLKSFNITSPNRVDCVECTGTHSECNGLNNGFKTDCGDDGIVRFEPINEDMDYDHREESPGGANLFPSTSLGQRDFYNLTFAMRAVGSQSSNTADAYPVGVFWLTVTFSNGQTVDVEVKQEDYISEINSKNLVTDICRSSAYWPVADALGSSVPVKPFDALYLARLDEANRPAPAAQYGAPTRLTNTTMCSTPITSGTHVVSLDSMSATVKVDNKDVMVHMCAVEEERTYGVTDWVMISIPSVQQSISNIHDELHEQIITDPTLLNDYYTTAELDYLLLTVEGTDVTSLVSPGHKINILLDGANPPSVDVSEEQTWMSPGNISNKKIKYYSWEEHASFLNYRRIRYTHLEKEEQASSIVSEPFNFAFIPGALLHSTSNVRVPVYVRAAIRFTTYAKKKVDDTTAATVVAVQSKEEKIFYTMHVSRAISASLRFDVDAYTPRIVHKTTKGLGKKSATALFIILSIAIVVVLAASVYIEVTYRRIIKNAKYSPKRRDSAVGIRYGLDGKPIGGAGSSPATAAAAATPSVVGGDGSIKTKFGVVAKEQTRVVDMGDSTAPPPPPPPADGGKNSNMNSKTARSVGEEQTRVSDDEIAEF